MVVSSKDALKAEGGFTLDVKRGDLSLRHL